MASQSAHWSIPYIEDSARWWRQREREWRALGFEDHARRCARTAAEREFELVAAASIEALFDVMAAGEAGLEVAP